MSQGKLKIIGICAICGRDMIEGPSVNEHHLLPKTFKGKETILLHKICHSKIHSVFTERELYNYFHTIERIMENEEMQKFAQWVKRKDPEFRDGHAATHEKQAKRRKRP